MIAWRNEAEAIGYATSCLDGALDTLRAVDASGGRLDVLDVDAVLKALAESTAAVVMVRHTRQGDALVTIDQLAADLVDTRAAQPRRRCCQTYMGEGHAARCSTWGLGTFVEGQGREQS
jgi:hypothetical protein